MGAEVSKTYEVSVHVVVTVVEDNLRIYPTAMRLADFETAPVNADEAVWDTTEESWVEYADVYDLACTRVERLLPR